MPTYRIDDEGRFVHFEPRKADELETQLEDALEDNDHVLLGPERLLYIGRQVTTDLNKAIDLLGVDSRRRLVVIELKKDRTPRDMMAQALEYTAFVRRMDYDALNSIAVAYFSRRGQPWQSLSEAHQDFLSEEESADASDIDWNSSQIVILVGQTVQPEITDVARYLRDHNIDVRALQFTYLESSSGERLVNVQTLVGGERMPAEASKIASQTPSLEESLAKVPAVRPLFDDLCAGFESAGLNPRKERTLIAFDVTRRGGSIINVWPSAAGRVIVLILGHRASTLGDPDAFQSAVEAMGLYHRRGKVDLSIHMYPSEKNKVTQLVESFKAHFLKDTPTG